MQMSLELKTKEFELLYSQVNELSKALPEHQFRTATALLVIIGWIITSTGAQGFIRLNTIVVLPATLLAFGLLIAFKLYWILKHYRKSCQLQSKLEALAMEIGVSVDGVSAFRPSPVIAITYFIINVLLCLAAVITVVLICYPITK